MMDPKDGGTSRIDLSDQQENRGCELKWEIYHLFLKERKVGILTVKDFCDQCSKRDFTISARLGELGDLNWV